MTLQEPQDPQDEGLELTPASTGQEHGTAEHTGGSGDPSLHRRAHAEAGGLV